MWVGTRRPYPAHCEGDLGDFCDILALSSLPAEEALARKISTMRAWVCAKACMEVPAKKREEANSAVSDSEEEADSSARRGYMGEFRQRRKFSAPMHHQPSDKVLTL